MATANHTSVTSVGQPEYQIRDVPGLTGYRVDTIGQVWSNRYRCRKQVSYDPTTPYHLLKQTTRPDGHQAVSVQKDGQQLLALVHRLVLGTFVGPQPPGMECRHLDGDPMNNRVENLTWGTRAENMHDRTRHGTDNGGERNQWAKLTNDQVVEIRERYIAGGIKQATLAAMYGVGVPAISTIVTGKAYVDAGGPISRTQTAEDLGRRVAKLTDTQVREIRDKAKQPGVRGKDLAVEYGVSRSTISRICGGYPRRGVS